MFSSGIGNSIDFPLVPFSLQKAAWEQFTQLMTTPEQRLEHATLIQEESMKFTKNVGFIIIKEKKNFVYLCPY